MLEVTLRQQRILDELKHGALYSSKLVDKVKEGPYSMGKDTLYKELNELIRFGLIRQFEDRDAKPSRVYYELIEKPSDYRADTGKASKNISYDNKGMEKSSTSNINTNVVNPEINVYVVDSKNTKSKSQEKTDESELHQPSQTPFAKHKQNISTPFDSNKFLNCLENHVRSTIDNVDMYEAKIVSFDANHDFWDVLGYYQYYKDYEKYLQEKRKANSFKYKYFFKDAGLKRHEDVNNEFFYRYKFEATYDPVSDLLVNYDEQYIGWYTGWFKEAFDNAVK